MFSNLFSPCFHLLLKTRNQKQHFHGFYFSVSFIHWDFKQFLFFIFGCQASFQEKCFKTKKIEKKKIPYILVYNRLFIFFVFCFLENQIYTRLDVAICWVYEWLPKIIDSGQYYCKRWKSLSTYISKSIKTSTCFLIYTFDVKLPFPSVKALAIFYLFFDNWQYNPTPPHPKTTWTWVHEPLKPLRLGEVPTCLTWVVN